MEEEKKLYDLTGISEIVGGDPNEINELNKMFLAEAPKSLSELNEFAENENWQKVSAMAHKLKSSIRLWNIEEIIDDIVGIELKAKDNSTYSEIPAHLEKVNLILNKALSQLQKEIK